MGMMIRQATYSTTALELLLTVGNATKFFLGGVTGEQCCENEMMLNASMGRITCFGCEA